MTPERREVVDFTDPVYTYGEGVVVNEKDTKAYKSYEEIEATEEVVVYTSMMRLPKQVYSRK